VRKGISNQRLAVKRYLEKTGGSEALFKPGSKRSGKKKLAEGGGVSQWCREKKEV